MSKFSRIAAAALITVTIAACSGNEAPDSDNVTETRMDDIDVIDGTISDEMVDVDTIQQADATGEEDAAETGEEKQAGSGNAQETAAQPGDETAEPAQ